MIYIVIFLVAGLAVLYVVAPKRQRVHAARAKRFPWFRRAQGRFLAIGPYYDPGGNHVDVNGKFVGIADGDSCAKYGIRHGDSFLADPLNDVTRGKLTPGKIVVVHGKAAASTSGYRLRKIEKVGADGIEFGPDKNGRPHRKRPFDDVVAVVTHVL